jgi:hypothetical protein
VELDFLGRCRRPLAGCHVAWRNSYWEDVYRAGASILGGGKTIRRKLLASCSYAALAVSLSLALGGSADAADMTAERFEGAFAGAATTISVEGGIFYNQSDSNLGFDPDDKLGDMDDLDPGGDGWHTRVDLSRTIDPMWDMSAGLGVLGLNLSEDSFFGVSAEQDLSVGLADVVVGYNAETESAVDLRLFGGFRGLYASNEAFWEEFGDETDGTFEDTTWSIGPRAGVDLAVPVDPSTGVKFVGSLSAAALFGTRQSDFDYVDNVTPANSFSTSGSEMTTIWNFEAMAGLNMPLGNNAHLTTGYRVQSFHNLVADRSDVNDDGSYVDDGDSDLIVHGPFMTLNVALDPD